MNPITIEEVMSGVYDLGELRLNLLRKELHKSDGVKKPITADNARLLAYLIWRHPEAPTRKEVQDFLWSEKEAVNEKPNRLKVRLNSLDELLEDPPPHRYTDRRGGSIALRQEPRRISISSLTYAERKALYARPGPWGKTNHGTFTISYEPVSESLAADIRYAARKYFGDYIDDITRIERIVEDSTSTNFKLTCRNSPPILFRVNKLRTDPEALDTLAALSAYLLTTSFLKDSPDRNAIVPLKPSHKHPRGCGVIPEIEEPLLSAYYFVESDGHYTGTIPELKSVALEYGRLQAALERLPSEIELTSIEKNRIETAKERINDWYRRVSEHYLAATLPYREEDIPFRLLQESDSVIREAVDRVQAVEPSWVGTCASYVDFHPHNTLMRRQRCVLLYDFDGCVRQSSQQPALAFAIHRFTRETIIRNDQRKKLHDQIKQAVDVFLKAYIDGGGRVDTTFVSRLPLLIQITNLRKLFYVCGLVTYRDQDVTIRSREALWRELRKFLTYIQEARFYEL